MGQVSCKDGCANCCSHAVLVTIPEGMLAYRALTQKGHWAPSLRAKLDAHAKQTWDLSPVIWHLTNIACPLLEKDRCLIYDSRPFSCRVTFSKGDPSYCHPHQADSLTQLLPKIGSMEEFCERQRRLLLRHKVRVSLIPLSKAILVGEKLVSGEEDMESMVLALARSIP